MQRRIVGILTASPGPFRACTERVRFERVTTVKSPLERCIVRFATIGEKVNVLNPLCSS